MGKVQQFTNLTTKERRELISELIVRDGTFHLPVKQLMKQFEVSQKTIYNDITWFKKNYTFEPLDEIKMEFNNAFISEFRQLGQEIRKAKTLGNKISILKERRETIKDFCLFMESFGIKEKVAEKLDIEERAPKEWLEQYEMIQEVKKRREARFKKEDEENKV